MAVCSQIHTKHINTLCGSYFFIIVCLPVDFLFCNIFCVMICIESRPVLSCPVLSCPVLSCPVTVRYILPVRSAFRICAELYSFFGTVKICKSFIMQGINFTKFKNSVRNKEEFSDERKASIILPVYKKGDTTDCIIYTGISVSLTSCKINPTSCSQG